MTLTSRPFRRYFLVNVPLTEVFRHPLSKRLTHLCNVRAAAWSHAFPEPIGRASQDVCRMIGRRISSGRVQNAAVSQWLVADSRGSPCYTTPRQQTSVEWQNAQAGRQAAARLRTAPHQLLPRPRAVLTGGEERVKAGGFGTRK